MTNTRVEAFAPATIANLGVGFDILGLAVSGAGDRIIAKRREDKGAVIESIIGDDGRLPTDPDKNVATIAANAFLTAIAAPFGISMNLIKGLPLASGLGSSAASSVAAVVAANALAGDPLTRKELLPFTLEGEAAVSGYHADNVAPCLLGGITLCIGTTAESIYSLPIPDGLYIALVTPDVEVPTAEARAVLPEMIPLKTMVHQTGSVAALVDALHRGDVHAIASAMESDEVVEPARQHLMPYMQKVRKAAISAGALSLTISGAGPTLCAICTSSMVAESVCRAMASVYNDHAIKCLTRHTEISKNGATVCHVE